MMKFTVVCCVLVVALVAGAMASPAKGSTKASLKKKPCLKECGDELKPVCAVEGDAKPISFGNECVLSNFNCENNKNLAVKSEGECPGGGSIRLF